MGGRKARSESHASASAGPTHAAPAVDAPAGRLNRGRKRRRGERSQGRSIFSRLLYWTLVLGLWIVIAAIGSLVFVASTLPPIQSLEVPKRPPTVEIVG